jgi:hypothetical protein
MAKATTAKPKAKKTVAMGVKAVANAAPKSKRKTVKLAGGSAADALMKLAEHPLLSEVLAIGASAAVVALAEGGLSGKKKASSKAVKSAGKAAAAAIGARLLSEFTDVTKASTKAKPAKPAGPAKTAKS